LTATFAMAFMTGLLGGFGHCLPMCGPIAGSLALAGGPLGTRRAIGGQLAYNAGRITTYAVLGATMGAAGSFVNVAGRLAGLSNVVAILAGVLMILMGLGAAGLMLSVKQVEAQAAGKLSSLARALLEGGGAGRLYPVGLALGFLPCGLSWTMFLGAAGTGHPFTGLALALAFGLGTLPALLLAGAAGTLLGVRARGALYRAGGLLVVALGVLFLLRGLGIRLP
jgi:sulfite exporter TauE/SafE